MTLSQLRNDFEIANKAFENLLTERFPGANRYTWYRALAAIDGGIGRRNDDTSRDAALAADADLKLAHDEYTRLLHIFYAARDGSQGVLGRLER